METINKIKQNYNLKTRYGITLSDYNMLLCRQKSKCGICKKEKKLYVDHCHTTKKVRALLCRSCNLLLGYSYDDKKILLNAFKFIEKHGKNKIKSKTK